MELLEGFDIPKLKLTEEELNQDITWERFRKFHYTVGEDFLDNFNFSPKITHLFAGYLIGKCPNRAADILSVLDDADYPSLEIFKELDFLFYSEEKDLELIYVDLAEFANFTKGFKGILNTIFLSTEGYYNET